VLEVSNLHVWRGEQHLLRGLHFSLQAGQALQLLWPNGTGKTTLLRVLAGFLHPEEGSLNWRGAPVQDTRTEFCWDLAYLGHDVAMKADLTPFENLRFACGLRYPQTEATLHATLAAVGLGAVDASLPLRSMSAGQQRRVALARLSLWGAKLWLLDEPASNLDAAGVAVLTTLLQAHLAAGGLVIMATHSEIALPGPSYRLWKHSTETP
jgi:heme exporter protein A